MPRTVVGLDIGSSGVRAAELVPGRRRPSLRRFAEVSLPPGVVRGGSVVDAEALTDALRTLWSRGRFRNRAVTVGLANAGVLVRQLDLDWMPAADFRKALRYQVQDQLPFSVDEAILDHHLLDDLELTDERGESRRIARILLVAAVRDGVEQLVGAVRAAGLRPVGVDLLPFALLRARASGAAPETDEPEAIVDVGADVVTVVVHAGGVPRYVRMVPGLGGDTVTEAVRARYDWAWDDAERTKVYVGLPGHAHLDPSQRSVVGSRADGLDHAAQEIVATAARRLVDEIVTTLDFYRDSATGSAADTDVRRVLLAGSGSLLGGFADLLAERLALPVERLDVRRQLRLPRGSALREADPATLAVPAGLCAGAGR